MTDRKPSPEQARADVVRALAEAERVSSQARRDGIVSAAVLLSVLGGTAAATIGRFTATGRWSAPIHGANAQGRSVWFPDWPMWTVVLQLIAIATLLAFVAWTRRVK
jgi:hypothetical protein